MADVNAADIGTRAVERTLRRVFNLAGLSVSKFVRGDVSPSVEVRPQFPWDFRDWNIHPWASNYGIGAVAAQFAYLEIQNVAAGDPFDVIITDIACNVAVNVFLNGTTQGAGTNAPPFEQDTFFAPGTLYGSSRVGGVFARFANIAAIAGVQVDNIPAAQERQNQRYILRYPDTGNLVIAAQVVNTAMSVTVKGFTIPADNSRV